MIKVKKNVKFVTLTPEMLNVIDKVITVWKIDCPDVTPVITSAFDTARNRHVKSKHYIHQALDFRTRNMNGLAQQKDVRSALTNALGADYDVVLESDHIHVEYDPK